MFRTELPLVPAAQQLPLSARVLTIGSCFSDTIGARLAEAKVYALVNPFGTVFNPISACKLLRAAAGEDTDWQQHLVEARGRWQSYDLHATLGATSPVVLLQTLQQTLRDTGVFLATADTVVLTLGSAWVYRLKETDELVSNCHKMPAEKFDKELLTPDEIINAVAETHAYLRLRNPKLRFVLTVSPVRHLKDTLPLNAVSKSVLRVACHYLSELLPDVSYFPAYELLLDDLRDYRFYAADMLHPSLVAEDYIWERFARTYFDADFGRFRKEWEAVRQALNHRPLYEAASEHRQFLVGTLERLEKLASRADMRMEILEVRKRLENLPLPTPVLKAEPEDDEERIDVGEAEEFSVASQAIDRPALPTIAEAQATIEQVDEEPLSEAETLAEAMAENSQPKKRRRSRGGAKRNKKKHAARLAEETAVATDNSEATAVEAVETPVSTEVDRNNETPDTVAFDPEAPLQTALERRKRASRRNRGRNRQTAEATADTTVPATTTTEFESAPTESAISTVAESLDSTDSVVPVVSEEVTTTEQNDATESIAPVVSLANTQRPTRTGRSASEVRAAALRKPRRPDSRIKALYATPATPTESEIEPVETVANSPEVVAAPLVAAADSSTSASATTATPVAPTTSVAPKVPVADAIPLVRGTGASGRLSASGQATRNAGPAKPAAPVSSVPTPSMPEEKPSTAPTPELSEVIETLREVESVPTASATAESASVETAANETATVITPVAPTARKSRPKPAAQKAKVAATPAEKPAPAKTKQKAKKTDSESVEPIAATEAPTPAASAEPAAPATRRKAAAKLAVAPELPAAKPKRATRPSRSKPKAPDEAADAS
jgi:hypothetical protein